MKNRLTMRENPYNGLLITFCGLDGSGKTTLINRLNSYFEKMDIVPEVTKQPTTTLRQLSGFRKLIDSPNQAPYLHKSMALMAAGDRIMHVHEVVEPALRDGKVVICDRYFYSCLAHLKAGGFKQDEWIYEISSSIIKPDAPFFLIVPPPIAASRVRQRENEKDRYIDLDFHRFVNTEYQVIAEQEAAHILFTDDSIDSTVDEMLRIIKPIVERKRRMLC